MHDNELSVRVDQELLAGGASCKMGSTTQPIRITNGSPPRVAVAKLMWN